MHFSLLNFMRSACPFLQAFSVFFSWLEAHTFPSLLFTAVLLVEALLVPDCFQLQAGFDLPKSVFAH